MRRQIRERVTLLWFKDRFGQWHIMSLGISWHFDKTNVIQRVLFQMQTLFACLQFSYSHSHAGPPHHHAETSKVIEMRIDHNSIEKCLAHEL